MRITDARYDFGLSLVPCPDSLNWIYRPRPVMRLFVPGASSPTFISVGSPGLRMWCSTQNPLVSWSDIIQSSNTLGQSSQIASHCSNYGAYLWPRGEGQFLLYLRPPSRQWEWLTLCAMCRVSDIWNCLLIAYRGLPVCPTPLNIIDLWFTLLFSGSTVWYQAGEGAFLVPHLHFRLENIYVLTLFQRKYMYNHLLFMASEIRNWTKIKVKIF